MRVPPTPRSLPEDLKAVSGSLDVGEHTAPGRVMLSGIAVAMETY
jgi:hypothetical protein